MELDNFRRKIFIKNELQRKILFAYRKVGTSENIFRVILNLDRRLLPRFAMPIQQANRCVLSGRKRSVSKLSRISRFKFRSLAYGGKLPSFLRSS